VSVKNPDTKHGTYVRYVWRSDGLVVLESGNYENGLKEGMWEFFYDDRYVIPTNSIKEKGHYVNGKKNGLWLYFHFDSLANGTKSIAFGKKKRKPDSTTVFIEHKDPKLMQAGMFLNDRRVGEWSAFDFKGNLVQRYNYSTKVLFDKTITDSSAWNSNRKAVFLGGPQSLSDRVTDALDINGIMTKLVMKRHYDSTSVTVTFEIDSDGKVVKPYVSGGNASKALNEEAVRAINTTDGYWIASLKDKNPVRSTCRVQIEFIAYELLLHWDTYVGAWTLDSPD
jgi:hypothetical protein